jgi:hypothetical protein
MTPSTILLRCLLRQGAKSLFNSEQTFWNSTCHKQNGETCHLSAWTIVRVSTVMSTSSQTSGRFEGRVAIAKGANIWLLR